METTMHTEPQKEHHWLQQLVGEWTYEHECGAAADQTQSKAQGIERVRSIGGLWVVGEGQGEMPGGAPATMIMTLGYDPQRKRYVGTWIGSMMTHLWVYDGSLDAAGKVLTLNAEGPSFTDEGKMVQYQDIIELKSNDHRVLRSQMLGDDGQWHQFMTANYRRKK
jgi:hypothetical protein